MSLFNFGRNSSKREDGELVFLLNINSSNILVSIALLRKENKPKIIYFSKETIDIKTEDLMESKEKILLSALQKGLDRLNRDGLKRLNFTGLKQKSIENCICFLSPFWHISKSKSIHIELNKTESDVLSAGDVVDLLQKESDLFKKESENTFSKSSPSPEIVLDVFEKMVMKFYLNGYSVSNPYGQRFHKASIPLFLSMARLGFLSAIRKSIYKIFPHIETTFHSSVFSSFVALRDFYPEKDDFMLIIISAENTEVIIVREDAISEAISFPIGESDLIKLIRTRIPNLNEYEVRSILSVKSSDSVNIDIDKKIEKAIKKIESDWTKTFVESLSSFSNQIFLPRDVFLVSEENALGSFFSFLIKDHADVFKIGRNALNVVAFTDKDSLQFVDFGVENGELDPLVALSTFCANRHI